jgi:hypothetical protein
MPPAVAAIEKTASRRFFSARSSSAVQLGKVAPVAGLVFRPLFFQSGESHHFFKKIWPVACLR